VPSLKRSISVKTSEEKMTARSTILLLLFVSGLWVTSSLQADADTNEIVSALMFICVGGGSEEKLEAQGQIDVALTLKKLRTGDIGGSGGIAGKFSKSEWQGLIGGISAQTTELQASQADKVRDCLKPYMPGIVEAVLKSNR
jgi:hypothetical protein